MDSLHTLIIQRKVLYLVRHPAALTPLCLSFTIRFSRAFQILPRGSLPKQISTQGITGKLLSAFIRASGPSSTDPSSVILSRWHVRRVLRSLHGVFLDPERSVPTPKRLAARRVARRDARSRTPIGSVHQRRRKCAMPLRISRRKSAPRASRHVCPYFSLSKVLVSIQD